MFYLNKMEDNIMAKGIEITAQRAQEVGIEGKKENETNEAFRTRVSGELQAMGRIIEANEAYYNLLYDDLMAML